MDEMSNPNSMLLLLPVLQKEKGAKKVALTLCSCYIYSLNDLPILWKPYPPMVAKVPKK
jgi:hypothetical protein